MCYSIAPILTKLFHFSVFWMLNVNITKVNAMFLYGDRFPKSSLIVSDLIVLQVIDLQQKRTTSLFRLTYCNFDLSQKPMILVMLFGVSWVFYVNFNVSLRTCLWMIYITNKNKSMFPKSMCRLLSKNVY